MNTIPPFRIRASAIGTIMTEPKGKSIATKIKELEAKIIEATEKWATIREGLKSKAITAERVEKLKAERERLLPYKDAPHLSQSCITYLEKWCNEWVYARRLEFTSKQTDKGNLVEGDAIVYACGHIPDMGLPSKNQKSFREDEWIQGTPDVLAEEYVFDVKSSWTHDTFPLYCSEIPNTDYDWQVKGYMHLTGKRKGRVLFVLMSMPEEMLRKEARWKLGQEFTEAQFMEWAAQYQYDDLPPCLRLKEYEVDWDDEAIEAVKRRVLECRAYIQDSIIPALKINAAKYGDDVEEEPQQVLHMHTNPNSGKISALSSGCIEG